MASIRPLTTAHMPVSFLTLPREIRDEIYTLILIEDRVIRLPMVRPHYHRGKFGSTRGMPTTYHMLIPRYSTAQVALEARQIFFAKNTFLVDLDFYFHCLRIWHPSFNRKPSEFLFIDFKPFVRNIEIYLPAFVVQGLIDGRMRRRREGFKLLLDQLRPFLTKCPALQSAKVLMPFKYYAKDHWVFNDCQRECARKFVAAACERLREDYKIDFLGYDLNSDSEYFFRIHKATQKLVSRDWHDNVDALLELCRD